MTRDTRTGLTLLGALLALALVGPFIAGDPSVQHNLLTDALRPPSLAHWLGTDQYARDVFARLAHGARISLAVATLAVAVAAALGTAIGLLAGAASGWPSRILGRVIDLGLALPRVIVLLVVLSAVGTLSLPVFAIVLGLTGWAGVARLVRGEALHLRHAGYVTAAAALGAPEGRILRREILPGTLAPVLVAATLGVADAMLLEAGLSFLGLGVRPPAPSWGGMLLEARQYLSNAPWLILAPGLALVAATSAATLLGDALRRALQPDTR